ncbi:MAG TPA: SDR family oxidoreductase [Gammaproteobacteria bacterium]|jgi:3-oxoacyl-[acyl-carrier protein] reductase|nr:SDR family oxidoreductase [Gammaproteobacteria bacterium]
MNLQLANKIAFVAASSDGLGYATALELAREKAKVVLGSRTAERVKAAKEKILAEIPDAEIFTCTYDLFNEQEIQKAVQHAANTLGGIDILITNAAGPKAGNFNEVSSQHWQNAFQISLMSAAHLIYAALPFLKKSEAASILTVTSTSGKQPIPGLFLSNVFRPAVLGMTKALSNELAPFNIRINSILPGWTATDRSQQLLQFYADTHQTSIEQEIERIANDIPLKRMAEPEEFAKVAAFLVSPAASYITGVMLQVDGGRCRSVM